MLKSCRALALISLLSLSVLIPVSAQEAVDCDAVTEIWQVQGSGDLSPCAGERVTLANNIVTAVAPLGFFMQTPSDRSDNDPATSDGLYVMTDFPPARIGMQAGDLVSVENVRAEEFYTRTQLNVTSMRRVIIESAGNPMPDAIDLLSVDLSFGADGIHPLERYEGMLVTANDALVVSPTNQFDEFGISLTGERAFREMGIETDATPEFAGLGLPEWDLNAELVEVDPIQMGLRVEQITPGARFSGVGGLTYDYGDYQLWTSELTVEPIETFALRPVRARNAGEFTIATQNVENLFDTVDDPDRDDSAREDYVPNSQEEYELRLGKVSEQVRYNLDAPDIVAFQEVENERVLNDVIARIEADDPTLDYEGCLIEGWDNRGIDVAFIYRAERVTVNECFQPEDLRDAVLPNGAPVFVRPPLVLEAEFITPEGNFPITLANMHNRSLGGVEEDSAQVQRLMEAELMANYVQARMDDNPDIHLAVMGDMNAFQFSDGLVDIVGIIAGTHNPAEARMAPEDDLVEPNLVMQIEKLPESERYSYIFNHNLQILDHILTTQTLDAYVTDVQFSRGDADALLAFETAEGAMRLSDHDGLVVYIAP